MRKNNIILEQVQIEYRFDFAIEGKDWEKTMEPLNPFILSSEKIDNDNKKILPKAMLKYLNFKNGQKYMITEQNISIAFDNYIRVYWEMRLVH